MAEFPMFPLGSVLFPAMPLHLRVFEERYLTMLSKILPQEPAEFGVVLIERGQEVGGGEHRFGVGTVAQVAELDAAENFISLVAMGDRRIEVVGWLEDDPFPRADIRELAELGWDDSLQPLREEAERVVRRVLAVASEYLELSWPADVELSGDPVEAAWQLAAIAPLESLDQVRLLRSDTMEQLLTSIVELVTAAEGALRVAWTSADDDGDSLG